MICGKRHLSYFPEQLGLKIPLTNLQQDLDLVIAKANEDDSARVVVFATGDPLFFGLGRLLLLKVAPQELNFYPCLLYTSPSPRDLSTSRMPSSA